MTPLWIAVETKDGQGSNAYKGNNATYQDDIEYSINSENAAKQYP